MYKFSAAGLETPSIPLKNPQAIRAEKRKQKVQRNNQQHNAVVKVQREKIPSGRKKDKRFECEGEAGVLY